MSLFMRRYLNEDDYWRIRGFLRDLFVLNGRREFAWQVARWDHWRWLGVESYGRGSLDEGVFIWEAADGTMAAVLNPEGRGEAFQQVHPAYRTVGLEREMVAIAEQHLARTRPDGKTAITLWAMEDDSRRQALLAECGFAPSGELGYQRRRSLAVPIARAPVPDGFVIRSLGDAKELPARSWASWRASRPNDPDENYRGWQWYSNIQRAPLYRRDLDIVAVAPSGEIASYCTLWFDDVTRTGTFEPVGTTPEHQRRGLAKAVMTKGLDRLKRMGATEAFVLSYGSPAHELYASMGFVDYDLNIAWRKEVL